MTSSQHVRNALDAATKALSQANSENHIKYARERTRNAAKTLHRAAHGSGAEQEAAEKEGLRLVDESIGSLEKAAFAERNTMRELKSARKGLVARWGHRVARGGVMGGVVGSDVGGDMVGVVDDDVVGAREGKGEVEGGEVEMRSLVYERLEESGTEGPRNNGPKRRMVGEMGKGALSFEWIEKDFGGKKANQDEEVNGDDAKLQWSSLLYGSIGEMGAGGQMRTQGVRDNGPKKRTVGEKAKSALRSPTTAERDFGGKKAKRVEPVEGNDAKHCGRLWKYGRVGLTGIGGEMGLGGEPENAIKRRSVSEKERTPIRFGRAGKKETKGKMVTKEQEVASTRARLEGEIRNLNPYLQRREW